MGDVSGNFCGGHLGAADISCDIDIISEEDGPKRNQQQGRDDIGRDLQAFAKAHDILRCERAPAFNAAKPAATSVVPRV